MKKLLLHITFLLISLVMIQSQAVFAQEIIPEPEIKEASPSTDKKVTTIEKSEKSEKEEIKVVDNESKDERLLNRNRNRKQQHFVDKDGDGINDNRCNGFGVNNGKCRGMKRGKK